MKSTVKPVRIIDFARKLQISTSTIIVYLKDKCFPVDRKHHSPLTYDIIRELALEYCSGKLPAAAKKLIDDAREWESANPEDSRRIKDTQTKKIERKQKRDEHAQRIIAGRDRARRERDKIREMEETYNRSMRSTAPSIDTFNGVIPVSGIDLEIIAAGLSLSRKKKLELLEFLSGFSRVNIETVV
ncbi:hypothetical protein ISS30_02850 [bacterium]|nr:hypothetical protein [bacterium]